LPIRGLPQSTPEICDENKLLLMFDEVQVEWARTGKLFAYEHDRVRLKPDILTWQNIGRRGSIGALLIQEGNFRPVSSLGSCLHLWRELLAQRSRGGGLNSNFRGGNVRRIAERWEATSL